MIKLNRKNKLLFLGIILSLYICYAFAVSKTVAYYRSYQTQKEIARNNNNDPLLLKKLAQKDRQLSLLLNRYAIANSTSFQNELLKNLADLSTTHNLKIVDFKEPHTVVENNKQVTSYMFSLEGSFNGMLLLVNAIENNPGLGSVQHMNFSKKKNYKNNSDYLTVEVILQRNESIKSDDKSVK